MRFVLPLLALLAQANADGFNKSLRQGHNSPGDHVSELKQLSGRDYRSDLEFGGGGRDLARFPSRMQDRDLGYVPGQSPEPVWFMSYPETGIVLFMHLMQSSSGYTTATNYGNVVMNEEGGLSGTTDSHPVYPDGPSLYSPDLALPEEFIAVRTHAKGFCFWCFPHQYNFADTFYEEAAKGFRKTGGKLEEYSYDPNDVKKMIHLIRDPFDTVVARFYSYLQMVKNNQISQLSSDSEWGRSDFKFNAVDFKRWCARMDGTFKNAEMDALDGDQKIRGEKIPCRQEFMKIIGFHNNVMKIQKEHGMERFPVKFEQYVQNTDRTVGRVNEFLHYPTNTSGMTTGFGRSGIWMFKSFFTAQDRRNISNFLRYESDPQFWPHIRMYTSFYKSE